MKEPSAKSPPLWDSVSRDVTARVERVRNQQGAGRASVITYLRDLEIVARRECPCRDTIQIIASGRHLLGDRAEIEPPDGALSRARGRRSPRQRAFRPQI